VGREDTAYLVPTQCLPSGVNVTAVLEASVAVDTGVCGARGGGGMRGAVTLQSQHVVHHCLVWPAGQRVITLVWLS
jgi:hypothetical protein